MWQFWKNEKEKKNIKVKEKINLFCLVSFNREVEHDSALRVFDQYNKLNGGLRLSDQLNRKQRNNSSIFLR